MATWGEVRAAAPELAAAVQACFDAHVHKVIATLRRDGSPRVSGTEATFWDDELWLGMMPDSVKALDLLRDPRFALHSATVDPEMAAGDAKLSGRAIEIADEATIVAFVSRFDGGARSGAAGALPSLPRRGDGDRAHDRRGRPAGRRVVA